MSLSPQGEQITGSSAGSYPRGRRTILIIAALVLALSPAIPFAMESVVPYKSLAPFYAMIVILLISAIALVAFGFKWRRWAPGRAAAGALAYLWVGAAALSAVGHGVLTIVAADAYGLRGSAWPRVTGGTALSGDIEYLVSLWLSVGVLCAACVATVLLVLSGRVTGLAERGRNVLSTVGQKVAEAPKPVELRYATGAQDRFLARMFSPVSRLLLLLAVISSIAAVPVAAMYDGPPAEAAVWLILLAPMAVSLWAVIESVWRPDEQLGVALLALIRTMVVPAAAGLVLGVAAFLPAVVPALWREFPLREWPQEFFGIFETISSLGGWLGMNILVGFLFALMGGLFLAVGVVLPWLTFFRPDQAIRDNMLSRDPQHRRRNIAVMRALSVLLVLVFLIPGLMNWGRMYDTQWWIGAALIPFAAGLLLYVYLRQRVDHKRRRRWFMQAPVPSPSDPRPPRHEPS